MIATCIWRRPGSGLFGILVAVGIHCVTGDHPAGSPDSGRVVRLRVHDDRCGCRWTTDWPSQLRGRPEPRVAGRACASQGSCRRDRSNADRAVASSPRSSHMWSGRRACFSPCPAEPCGVHRSLRAAPAARHASQISGICRGKRSHATNAESNGGGTPAIPPSSADCTLAGKTPMNVAMASKPPSRCERRRRRSAATPSSVAPLTYVVSRGDPGTQRGTI